jgi:protein-L-isoaspartate(D-aspartate) O-methyltransferase
MSASSAVVLAFLVLVPAILVTMRATARPRAMQLVLVTAMATGASSGAAAGPDYAAERARMLRVIEMYAAAAGSALGRDHIDPRVLAAIDRVPRHEFVPEEIRNEAYADRPLPIGFGQTISQPFIVALMTDLLDTTPDSTVLELGTGSGYQAAVLSQLVRRVYTVEIVPALAATASERLNRFGYGNVETRTGDGYYGWTEAAPFDGILVTAATSHVPPPLIQQLKRGGRMVIPLGGPFSFQFLVLVEKQPDGGTRTQQLLPVQFVPLTHRD